LTTVMARAAAEAQGRIAREELEKKHALETG